MTSWDRIQRQDLELREAKRRIEVLMARVEELADERDRARRLAVRLEQENHALAQEVCFVCGQHLVAVPLAGEAR